MRVLKGNKKVLKLKYCNKNPVLAGLAWPGLAWPWVVAEIGGIFTFTIQAMSEYTGADTDVSTLHYTTLPVSYTHLTLPTKRIV